jgi:hypothetical protein
MSRDIMGISIKVVVLIVFGGMLLGQKARVVNGFSQD